MLMALFAVASACNDEPQRAADRQRHGRLGSLRDLVLFDRPGQPLAQALFVDRFEVTCADWVEFAATPAGRAVGADGIAVGSDLALPIAGVNLRQARAFANWRCLRLPARVEWEVATTGEARSRYPWGDRLDGSRANTGELGLLAATPVGTFESGRRAGGDQPYDLIGNVSEWTETVPPRWFHEDLDAIGGLPRLRDGLLRSRATSVWAGVGGLFPSAWLVQLGGDRVPREVVGADFQCSMETLVEAVPGGDRRQRTGLRLYGVAADLVAALVDLSMEPTPAEVEQLRDFLRRDGHRAVLTAAFEKLMAPARTPFARLLAQELGFAAESPR